MPATAEITTSETIVVGHACFLLLITLGLGVSIASSPEGAAHSSWQPCVVAADVGVALATAAWYRRERMAFKGLVGRVKDRLRAVHPFVGAFKEIDRHI